MIVPCSILWPKENALNHWGEIAGMLGAQFDPVLPRPFVIAIRGVEPFHDETHDLVHRPVYDDTFVLLCRGFDPVVFPGATHAYQRNSKESPDVVRDGLGDVGSIRPGVYLLNDTNNGAEVVFRITMPNGDDKLPAWRDFDHDGKLSPEEMQLSEELRLGPQVGGGGTWSAGILLHGGPDEQSLPNGAPPQHRSSIGCFTAPRSYRTLISQRAKASGGKADLVLVNAYDLAHMLEDRAANHPPTDSSELAPDSRNA